MTSNIGSHLIQETYDEMPLASPEEVAAIAKNKVFDLLRKTLRPEFLNRIDEIIMFHPLTRKDVEEIVKLQFAQLKKLLKEQGFELEATQEAIDWIAQLGFDPQYGARPVKRVFQRKVLNELSKYILAGKVDREHPIVLDMFDGELVFRKPLEHERV